MKYSLDFQLTTTNKASRDAVTAEMPAINDVKIDPDSGYDFVSKDQTGTSDAYTTTGMIRYKTEADRDAVVASVLGKDGVLSGYAVGSYVQAHDCTHDGTGGPCVVTETHKVVV